MFKHKFINFRPLLFLAISLITGILCAYCKLFSIGFWALFPLAVFLSVLTLKILFIKRNKNAKETLVFLCVYILIFLAGFTCFSYQVSGYENADKDGHYYTVTGRISKINQYEGYTTLVLDDVNLKGVDGGDINYNIQLFVYNDENLKLGDIITFDTSLTDRDIFYDGRFSAQSVYNKIKFNAQIDFSEISVIDNNTSLFEKGNLLIKNTLEKGLSTQSFSIAYALLTGDSSFIDQEVLASFRLAGVAHVFAVSGLHIGFLATFLSTILSRIKSKRYFKAIFIVSVLVFYSGVCGFSASSVRATVMTSVLLFSKCFGERYDRLSSISLSIILVLFISPVLLFTVGFLLSFSIALGLIILTPSFNRALRFLPEKLKQSVSSILIAFLIGSPIMLAYFGSVSLFSIIANFLLLPVVGFIYVLTFVSTIISAVTTLTFILFPTEILLKGLAFIIGIIDYKIFIVGGIVLGSGLIFYYLGLLIASNIFNIKPLIKSVICITLAICFVFSTVNENIDYNKRIKFYVSGSNTLSYTLVSKDERNLLVIHNLSYVFSSHNLERVLENLSITELDDVVILSNGKSIDLQIILTKLCSLTEKVDNLYYYGEKQENQELIANVSFPQVSLHNVLDFSVNNHDYSFSYFNDGACLLFEAENKRILMFGRYGENISPDLVELDNVDLIIAYDYLDRIKDFYEAKEVVSLRKSNRYTNAESSGYLPIVFK